MSKINPKQLEILLSYISNHSNNGTEFEHAPEAKSERREIWTDLADKLNRHGPPEHSWFEWESTWSDYKNNIKRKLTAEEKLLKRKNCNKRVNFNTFELTVIDFLKLERAKAKMLPEISLKTTLIKSASEDSLGSSTHTDQHMDANNDKNEQENMIHDTLKVYCQIQEDILKELKETNRIKRKALKFKEDLYKLEQEKFIEKGMRNAKENKRYELAIPKHQTRAVTENVILLILLIFVIYYTFSI